MPLKTYRAKRRFLETPEPTGELKFVLHGEKLREAFVQLRFRGEKNWLLIKQRDELAV